MVTLFEQEIRTIDRQSSKGNQLKWFSGDIWYKADYTGYEGLAEYVVSAMLEHSTCQVGEYVRYETEQIQYGANVYLGCRSENFLPNGWQLITLERLFKNHFGESLYQCLYRITELSERLRFLVTQTERLTGLRNFGIYMSKILTLDALFLNEDRHTHNIAVMMDPTGEYHLCPFFDYGASLLADTTMDYPMGVDLEQAIDQVEAKTFHRDFEEQLEIAEKLYGQHIHFSFGEKEILDTLERELFYSDNVKERVGEILRKQRRKYAYLFSKT